MNHKLHLMVAMKFMMYIRKTKTRNLTQHETRELGYRYHFYLLSYIMNINKTDFSSKERTFRMHEKTQKDLEDGLVPDEIVDFLLLLPSYHEWREKFNFNNYKAPKILEDELKEVFR